MTCAELSFGKRSALVAKYCSVSLERVESSHFAASNSSRSRLRFLSSLLSPSPSAKAFHRDLDLLAPTRITPFMTRIYLSPSLPPDPIRMRYAFFAATAVTLRAPWNVLDLQGKRKERR